MALERVGAEAFEGPRLKRSGSWVVAFSATWCPYCRAFEPEFERGPAGASGRLIADVSDTESSLWERFGLDVVPTLVAFREGEAVLREDGRLGYGIDPNALRAFVERAERG